jgi:muramidase (phage lysozyme)
MAPLTESRPIPGFILTPQRSAFLDALKLSELDAAVIAASDDGFNVLVGSTGDRPLLFPTLADGTPDYSQHPNIFNAEYDSTAAGAFQLLHRFWLAYKMKMELKDFSPDSQRAIALQQVKERLALPLVDDGQFAAAILRCNEIWASLPGAPYGQHTNAMPALQAYFVARGGILHPSASA